MQNVWSSNARTRECQAAAQGTASMPHLTTLDGDSLTVSPDQFATLRRLLDGMDGELLRRLLDLAERLTPDRRRALMDVIDQQIAVDAYEPEPRPTLRVVDSDGAILHPTACERRCRARLHSEPEPTCRWVRDGAGFSCAAKVDGASVCGFWVGPDRPRHDVLSSLFGDADLRDAVRLDLFTVVAAVPHELPLMWTKEHRVGDYHYGSRNVFAATETQARIMALGQLGEGAEILSAVRV